ncbi:hypothetical protein PUN28_001222 [Cardiocondyla obscurior]|uniref:Uncharacterized protein n=1 Tax=Cardiocondyla obscurior TaxID=286306 RepID=A0AAW2H3Y9_9HYME
MFTSYLTAINCIIIITERRMTFLQREEDRKKNYQKLTIFFILLLVITKAKFHTYSINSETKFEGTFFTVETLNLIFSLLSMTNFLRLNTELFKYISIKI